MKTNNSTHKNAVPRFITFCAAFLVGDSAYPGLSEWSGESSTSSFESVLSYDSSFYSGQEILEWSAIAQHLSLERLTSEFRTLPDSDATVSYEMGFRPRSFVASSLISLPELEGDEREYRDIVRKAILRELGLDNVEPCELRIGGSAQDIERQEQAWR